ncbi:MAG: hypothetical protein EON56_02275 [Alphaproteobacteria bacterium]|nr:MAG: hypothetical protein EON56_02275 [Alphaproteobacteria bacterium]
MNRKERRPEGAVLFGSLASHPAVKRMIASCRRIGAPSPEIFTQHDDGTGKPRYFDVISARLWCDAHKPIEALDMDFDTVRELVSSGRIDPVHLARQRFDQEVAPVIFLRRATAGGGLLLDGAHRYVAFAHELMAKGLESTVNVVPAYLLEPVEWEKFILPAAVARACGLTSS